MINGRSVAALELAHLTLDPSFDGDLELEERMRKLGGDMVERRGRRIRRGAGRRWGPSRCATLLC